MTRNGPRDARRGPARSPNGKPAHGKPAHGKPAHGKPAHGKPAHGKPAHGKPAHGKPAHDVRPVHGAPVHGKGEHTSPRVAIPRGKPLPGVWLWTSREDASADLVDELTHALGPAGAVRELEPGLVETRGAPTSVDGAVDVTFARQGLPIAHRLAPGQEAELAARVLALVGDAPSFDLQVWAPDSERGNRRMPGCAELEARTLEELARRAPELAGRRLPADSRAAGDGALVSVVSLADGSLAVGATPVRDAVSPFPGGRARMRVEADRPSRAARKVEEALAWLGLAPGPGEVCVDLGAAPGGWSWALLERRARVIAVDPAELRPDVARHRGMRHEKKSAFGYEPEEPVDWLFCDMAWRPLEAAQLLAKWGRRRWARLLVANLKLPMKQKAKIVEELRAIVHGGGWTRVRTRQLYHDRDEITLVATR